MSHARNEGPGGCVPWEEHQKVLAAVECLLVNTDADRAAVEGMGAWIFSTPTQAPERAAWQKRALEAIANERAKSGPVTHWRQRLDETRERYSR